MTLAIVKKRLVSAPFTFQGLINAVSTAFSDASLGLSYQYTFQGRTHIVYKLIDFGNSDLSLGVSFKDIGDQIVIVWRILSKFDPITNGSEREVNSGENYLSKQTGVILYPIIHPEIRGVCLVSRSSTFFPLCYLKPLNKAVWWNDYLIPFVFLGWSNFQALKSLTPTTTLYDNTSNSFSFPSFNVAPNQKEIFDIAPEGVALLSNSAQGSAGYFEDIHQTSYWPVEDAFGGLKYFFIARVDDILDNTWCVMSSGLAIPINQIEVLEV